MKRSDRISHGSLGQNVRQSLSRFLSSIWNHRLVLFCFLIPLSITVFGRSGRLLLNMPPIVPLTALFWLVALAKGGARQVVSAWQASPFVLWLYLLVCAVEVVLMLYHRNPNGWVYIAGRVTFLMIALAIAALCDGIDAARDSLLGVAYGVGLIGLATIIHASGLVYLPFAGPLWPARTFGPIEMPFARTVGLEMSPNKYGILAAVALGVTMVRVDGRAWLVRPNWIRVPLFVVVVLGAVITQQRGVYITVAWVLGLGVGFALVGERVSRRLATARVAWLLAGSFMALLALGSVVFPYVAPEWFLNVGSEGTIRNVTERVDANVLGWQMFKRSPLTGIGHGMFTTSTGFRVGIHNHFWEQVVATGILGGIPYLLFHLLVLIYALQLFGSTCGLCKAVASALVVSVSATCLAYQFFPGFFTSVFAVVCGLVISVRRDEKVTGRLLDSQVG